MKFRLLTCFILASIAALSQESGFRNEFGFRSDNDSFLAFGQDQYYTNGLFISFRHAARQDSTKTQLAKKIWEAEAGQYMFNGYTGKINRIENVDRPFAAYLYAGGRMLWVRTDEQSFEAALNVGTIGPQAFGKEVQETLHEAIGFYEINGWQWQVNNAVGINASLKYTTVLSRPSERSDFSLNSYVNLGNTFVSLGSGILFRSGRINPFFNSVSNNTRISNTTKGQHPEKEFFFFTRPMLNLVIYDATVEGGMFLSDQGPVTYSPKRVQYAQELGFNYAVNRWTLNFFITLKSREVKTQKTAHQYGSAMVYYRF
jgi:lipid A 3-O-deacylase